MFHNFPQKTPAQIAAKEAKAAEAIKAAFALLEANPEPKTFATQVARLAWYRAKLLVNPKWALKALLAIYAAQTAQEQTAGATIEWNGAGFGAFDAEILTSFAQRVQAWDAETTHKYPSPLSPKQMAIMHAKISKYAGQLIDTLEAQGKAIPTKAEVAKKTPGVSADEAHEANVA